MSARTTGSSETTPSTAKPVLSGDLGLEQPRGSREVRRAREVLRGDRELGVVQRQRLGRKLQSLDLRQRSGLERRRSGLSHQREATAVRPKVHRRGGGAAGGADLGVVLEQHEVRARTLVAQHRQRGRQDCDRGVTQRGGLRRSPRCTWPTASSTIGSSSSRSMSGDLLPEPRRTPHRLPGARRAA